MMMARSIYTEEGAVAAIVKNALLMLSDTATRLVKKFLARCSAAVEPFVSIYNVNPLDNIELRFWQSRREHLKSLNSAGFHVTAERLLCHSTPGAAPVVDDDGVAGRVLFTSRRQS